MLKKLIIIGNQKESGFRFKVFLCTTTAETSAVRRDVKIDRFIVYQCHTYD